MGMIAGFGLQGRQYSVAALEARKYISVEVFAGDLFCSNRKVESVNLLCRLP